MKRIRAAIRTVVNRVDMFGTPLSLTYPHGRSVHRTCFGGCLTIGVGLITFLFLLHEVMAMIQRSQTRFTSQVKRGGLPNDTTFSEADGFKVAFSVRSENSEVQSFIDQYVSVEANLIAEISDGRSYKIPITTSVCKEENFFPIAHYQEAFFERIKDKFTCIDLDNAKILANQYAPAYSLLSIMIGVKSSICTGTETECVLSAKDESLLQ